MVEHQLPKLRVAGSNPVSRSIFGRLFEVACFAQVAQSVEHILGKDEVTGSNPVLSSIFTAGYGACKSAVILHNFISE